MSYHLFPFDKVPKNSRIVLYGAGNVGKQFYDQVTETNFCEIVLWLDKKADGILIKKPETVTSLNATDYDIVVIAIYNETIMLEVKTLLMNYGISESKIIHHIHQIPSCVSIEASTLCQLNCKTCYMRKSNSGTVGKGYLKLNDFKKFVLTHKFITKIELSNSGEIFLNPDLIDILKCAFENKVELTANGGVNFNTVSNEVIEALVVYNFRSMKIAIDGASQKVYSEYRRNGNFDTVISNIKKLNYFKNKYNSEYPKLVWQYIIMEHNENEVSKAKEMAKELGIELIFKLTWDWGYIPKNVDMLKKETGLQYLARKEILLATGKIPYHLCHQLWESPQINYDGRLLGCCAVYLDDFGVNVFEVGLERAINSANYITAKKMLKGEIDTPKDVRNIPCVNCGTFKTMKKENIFIRSRA